MTSLPLPPDQEAQAQQIFQLIQQAFLDEALALARLLASKQDAQLLGKTEFDIRDALLRLGASTLQTALQTRKKARRANPTGGDRG
jgi:hypothetical protein